MPIVIPVLGASDPPSSEVIYAARSSIRVGSEDADAGRSSVSVTSTAFRAGMASITPSATVPFGAYSSIRVGNGSRYPAYGSAEILSGDSFLILADLLSEDLSGPNLGSFGFAEIHAELEVNDVVVPIKSFQYQVPTGRLGSILNIRLAVPNVSAVPAGASVKFSLKVRVNGVQSTYVLLDNGKLQEREYQISYTGGNNGGPQDEVSFSSLDVISDKFGLAPRRPVVMFDPYRVRYDQVQTRNDQAVRDEQGRPILPIVEPVAGLSMRTILRRAYTGAGGFAFITSAPSYGNWGTFLGTAGTDQQGCGFTGIVTNITDYKVRRADFSIENGWHDGAQPTVAMYAPVYFVENGVLFIIDVDKPLPYGITPHQITLAAHKNLTERIEYKPDANAVLLTYQYDGNDPSEDPAKLSRDVYNDEVVDESGTEGEVGWSKITTRRWDREVYMADAPDDVLDTFPLSVETETQQSVVWYDADGLPSVVRSRVTHQETTDYLYEGDLKIRHIKEVKAAVPDPGAGFLVSLIVVERETCEISWKEDPNNPGVKIQDRVRIDTVQRCAYDPNTLETITDDSGSTDFVRMIPILLAQASGVIDETWLLSDLLPSSSVRMALQNMKGSQYDVEVIEIDYLNNTHKKSYTEPTTGSTRNDPFESKSRTILLRDTVSEAEIGYRIPVPVNAYELPRARALELGYRVLRRLNDPLQSLPISMAGVDFVIARGSIIKGQKRSGYTGNYFVTGYSINGDNLGKRNHRISQTLEATELLSVS